MHSIHFVILPPPAILKNEIECVRIAKHHGEEAVTIQVSPTGAPGMVFHHHNGHAALEHIVTHSGRSFCPPPLFLSGPVIPRKPLNVIAWRVLRQTLDYRKKGRHLLCFRRDPRAYLISLEEHLC